MKLESLKEHVHSMDCLEYLKTIEDERYQLIIADPPYFEINGDFDFEFQNLDHYLDWCRQWIKECHRVLATTGSFYLWGKIGFGKGFALFKLADWFESENLFTIRNWITQKNTRGRGTKRGYMEAREELIFATKGDTYTWNTAYTEERSNRKDLGADGKPRKNKFKRASDVWTCFAEASQSSKQRFKLSTGENFPTVKAMGLCKRIIQASSNAGDKVYIPFGGSGSEAVACQELDRSWELTETNDIYVNEIILPRLENSTGSNPTSDSQ